MFINLTDPLHLNSSLRTSTLLRALLIPAAMSLCVSFCAKPQLKQMSGCNRTVDLEGVVDIADAGSGLLFVAVHDRRPVDAKGESLNGGRIVTVHRRTLEVKELIVQGRDEYPFKPLGIDAMVGRNEPMLFVVNEAYHNQRSIEVYRLQRGNLVFQKRIRTARMQGIRDIALVSPDEYVIVREKRSGLFGGDGDLILHRSLTLRYLPLKTGGALYAGKAGERTVLIPNGSALMELDVDRLTLREIPLSVGESPSVANIADGRLFVLHESEQPQLSIDAALFVAPVKDPSTFFVLSPEKSIVFGRRSGGLTVCELPAP